MLDEAPLKLANSTQHIGFALLKTLLCVQVMDCYFPKDKYLNRRKNFCFVTFATQQVKPLGNALSTALLHIQESTLQALGARLAESEG